MTKLVAKKKICVVSISLAKGGAERSTALLTRMLDRLGHEVHIVILEDKIAYEFAGKLFNLGKPKKLNDHLFRRLKRFQKLKRFIHTKRFDLIIDNRVKNNSLRELYYLKYLYTEQKLVYVIRSGNLNNYLAQNTKVLNDYMIRFMENKVVHFVAVSKHIKKEVKDKYNIKNISTIYNPIDNTESHYTDFKRNYILFAGRLVDAVKNLRLLLHAYSKSRLPQKNINLIVLGTGSDFEMMKSLSEALGVGENVKFLGYKSKLDDYYANAKFTVLTSRYEGYPRVLIESLAAGTPVVSVDCKSGPEEIIQNETNGLLVENNQPDILAWAMNRMFEDKELYIRCLENAKSSVSHLKLDKIALEWQELIEQYT